MGRISLPCSVFRKKAHRPGKQVSVGVSFSEKAAGAGRYESIQPSGPTEYPCYIKEDNRPYATAGADVPSQGKAFVRRTTPHYGGTSRGTSYSVRRYSTPYSVICKSLFSGYRYHYPHCFFPPAPEKSPLGYARIKTDQNKLDPERSYEI